MATNIRDHMSGPVFHAESTHAKKHRCCHLKSVTFSISVVKVGLATRGGCPHEKMATPAILKRSREPQFLQKKSESRDALSAVAFRRCALNRSGIVRLWYLISRVLRIRQVFPCCTLRGPRGRLIPVDLFTGVRARSLEYHTLHLATPA